MSIVRFECSIFPPTNDDARCKIDDNPSPIIPHIIIFNIPLQPAIFLYKAARSAFIMRPTTLHPLAFVVVVVVLWFQTVPPSHGFQHQSPVRYQFSFPEKCPLLSLASDSNPSHETESSINNGIRLNKIFKATHSRREADKLIQEGRVSVNGEVSYGQMVVPFQDTVTLDGRVVQGWEQMNGIAQSTTTDNNNANQSFEYIKYYKPRGVICTTDRRIRGNIIHALTQESGFEPRHRVYPVGRLDKDSSGLILITSDGRLPNASLRREQKQSKVYRVTVEYELTEQDLEDLRSGIVITTVAQRDGTSKPLTAKTKPCTVTSYGPRRVEIVLQEGRNRQIRKMMAALDNRVVTLHRVAFGKIGLDRDMSPGDWKELSPQELGWIESLLDGAPAAAA